MPINMNNKNGSVKVTWPVLVLLSVVFVSSISVSLFLFNAQNTRIASDFKYMYELHNKDIQYIGGEINSLNNKINEVKMDVKELLKQTK